MKKVLTSAIILIAVGAIGLIITDYYLFAPGPGGPYGQDRSRNFASNGERIFFTGTSSRDAIDFSGGPPWMQMMGGGCVDCHGPDGRGGWVMMSNVKAPDVRYKTLTKPHEEEGSEETMPAFTDKSIKRAITQGKDSDDSNLNPVMPRWRMSDQDLNDIIGYLKTFDR